MHIFFITILLLFSFLCSGFSNTESIDKLETIFKTEMPNGIIYTKVPRGLIISIDESLFFNNCETDLNGNSLYILDDFAEIFKNLPNYCVIEDHVQKDICTGLENWELSMIRAANIAEYLVKCKNIPTEKIFDIGFGETMPFKDNVDPIQKGLNNRIDLVIIDYDVKR